MRLVYISQGNIPSKWAHTFQAMKMAAAFSGMVQDFTLLTAKSFFPSKLNRIDLWTWYGLDHAFRIQRLPVYWRIDKPFFTTHRSPRFDKLAARYAQLYSADVVYTRSPGAARACVELSVPTILETHAPGLYDLEYVLPCKGHPSFLGIVTISAGLRDDYINLGMPASSIMLAPDAVDLERFTMSPSKKQARSNLSLPQDQSIAVYCGHFYPEKGVDCLIEAAVLCPEVQFYLVGGWPEDIARLKKITGKHSNIHLPGFVSNSEIPQWLSAADVLVLPNSVRFGQARITSPLKLFEYMASNRPIVATAIPALKDLLLHRKNALVVESDAAGPMAQSIAILISNQDLGSRLARQAWQDVQAFSWTNRASGILEHFGLR